MEEASVTVMVWVAVVVVVEEAVAVVEKERVVVVVVLAGAAAEVVVTVVVVVDCKSYEMSAFWAGVPSSTGIEFGSTYSNGTGNGRESCSNGVRGGGCLSSRSFGYDKSTTDHRLGILRERAWFSDLRTYRILRSTPLFHTSTTNGWHRGRSYIGGSLLGDVASLLRYRCKASRSRNCRSSYGARRGDRAGRVCRYNDGGSRLARTSVNSINKNDLG